MKKSLFILCFLCCLTLAACGTSGASSSGCSSSAGSGSGSSSQQEPEEQIPPEEPVFDLSSVQLVNYEGVVEHLFFHPVVAYPELAFDGDKQSNGIDDWMVTVDEYNKILSSLYAND